VTSPRAAPELTVRPAPGPEPAASRADHSRPAPSPAGTTDTDAAAVPWWAARRPSTSDGHGPAGATPAVDVRAVADLVYAALVRRQEIERDRGGW
jgi:hypothetical protein